MAAQGFATPVFSGFDWGRMLVAGDELGALTDRFALELPRMVEKVRLIDEPREEERVAA